MPADEKPYRLYRGGRAKGRVPLQRHTSPTKGGTATSGPGTAARPDPRTRPRRRWGRWIAVGSRSDRSCSAIVWGVAGYLSFRSGVGEANARIPGSTETAAGAKQDGLLTSTPTTILVLGTDGAARGGRANANRTDSIMLLRTDPRRHRLAFLSIPRDLRVEIPEVGTAKINAAFQYGGAPLALRTIRELTGHPHPPHRGGRLRPLPGADRRRGRDRGRRAEADPVESRSTARMRRRSAARSGTAGGSRRASSR